MTKNDGKRRTKARNPGKWLSIVLPCYPQPAEATRNEKLNAISQERRTLSGTIRSPGIRYQETAAHSASNRRQKMDETRLDRTSQDLTGRNATLRVNSCPSWIPMLSQAPSVRTHGDRATPTQTKDLACTPKTENSKLEEHPLPRKKIARHLGTFGDIWGHMSHFRAKTRGPQTHYTRDPDDPYVRFTRTQIMGPAAGRIRTDRTN